MSFVNDMFDRSKGAGYTGTNAPILSPISGGQTQDAYNQAQQDLQRQRDLVGQLQAQQGLQNQAQVYGQGQDLAAQLALQAQGGGPNPALAQLQQTTGQNVANQAALMAGQRGSNQNAGLLARQAAQQGAATQQQAAGQGAVMRAQQQLAAQGALQNQQSMLGNLANQQAGQYIQGVGNLNQLSQNEQQALYNAAAQQNNAAVGMQSNVNNVNAGIAQGNQGFQQGIVSSIGKNIGGASQLFGAKGGEVPGHYDDGGIIGTAMKLAPLALMALNQGGQVQNYDNGGAVQSGPQSTFGKLLQGTQNQSAQLANQQQQQNSVPPGASNFQVGFKAGQDLVGGFFPSQSKKDDKSSPSPFDTGVSGNASIGKLGSSDLPSMAGDAAEAVAHGGSVGHKLKKGGHVPGKAKVKGDSLQNDTIDAKLSPGEIVIPRSIATSQDAPRKAADFVAAILAKKRLK